MQNELEQYFDKLWPICRSITGNGLRESLSIINELIPLELTEVPSGTEVFDWTIPKEWNINDAYIIAPDGKKIDTIYGRQKADSLRKHINQAFNF